MAAIGVGFLLGGPIGAFAAFNLSGDFSKDIKKIVNQIVIKAAIIALAAYTGGAAAGALGLGGSLGGALVGGLVGGAVGGIGFELAGVGTFQEGFISGFIGGAFAGARGPASKTGKMPKTGRYPANEDLKSYFDFGKLSTCQLISMGVGVISLGAGVISVIAKQPWAAAGSAAVAAIAFQRYGECSGLVGQ